jgi:hypothetical protein
MSSPQIPPAMQELAAKFRKHNDVPWQKNTENNPFWKQTDRVEVKLRNGDTRFVESPKDGRSMSHAVIEWRPTALSAEDIKRFSAAFTQGTQKAMPVVYRHLVKAEWFRTFTWRERFALLFGANVVVLAGVACEKDPGKEPVPVFFGAVSKHTTADGHMREALENVLADANSPVHQLVQQEPPKK